MASLRQMRGPGEFLEELESYETCSAQEGVHPLNSNPSEKADNPTFSVRNDENLARLAETIETQIVPKLVMAHRDIASTASDQAIELPKPTVFDVDEFTNTVLNHDLGAAHRFIANLSDQGVSMESIYLDLLSPTARLLGDRWVEDLADFSTVTLGLSKLQQILRSLSHTLETSEPELSEKHAMLVTVPGEQHGFGVAMVGEFFRRAGWNVWTGTPESDDEILDLLGSHPYDVVGFSISCDMHYPALERIVNKVRDMSSKPDVGLLLGGRFSIENASFVGQLNADIVGIDPYRAVHRANEMLGETRINC